MAKGGAKTVDPLEDLKVNGPKPIYVIDGEERLLVDEAVRLLKEHAIPKNARDFNYDAFSGKQAKLVRIIEAARMLPAFAPRRMVLVDQADTLDLDDSEVLMKYLESPSPTTVLVFVGEKFDARTKVYKMFQKAGVVLRYPRPKLRDMADLVRRRAAQTGVRIEESALRALIDAVGADASAAFQALELLALYVGPRRASEGGSASITVEDVSDVVSLTREESVFAMADAIGKRSREDALRGLHGMLSVSREPALRVLAMIARHWRNLARTRSLIGAGVSEKEIEGAVGLLPFQVEGLLRQARQRREGELSLGLQMIAETDRALKGGSLADTRSMERLVLRLMSGS